MKRPVAFRIIVAGSLGALLSAAAFYLSDRHYNRAPFYRDFGIAIPKNYNIHGIDVSRYQQDISWPDVQAMHVDSIQLGFVFIKATSSTATVDPSFSENYLNAKATGLAVGTYHFFDPDADGFIQAENFIDHTMVQPGDLPPVLDVESIGTLSLKDFQQHISDWLQAVEKKYDAKPIIYSNIYFYENFLADKFGDYPLWIANYFSDDRPRLDHDWLFWQHSSSGNVNGIRAKTDFDVFNGDSAAFRAILLR